MSELVDKLFSVHDSLTAASLPHAFGGAIALAYCVEEPRGTRDLDVNVFTDASNAEKALASFPDGVSVAREDIEKVIREGQARLWWDGVPIDVFLNNLPLHEAVSAAVVWVPLRGREIPVLDCTSLTIFKSFFDRTQDWADIEAIAQATSEDIENAAATIRELMGENEPACQRLASILSSRVG